MDVNYSTLLYHAVDDEVSPLGSYATLLLYYSERKLTYESDTLEAVAGLLGRLGDRMATRFFQGLPRATFDAALLFLIGPSRFWTVIHIAVLAFQAIPGLAGEILLLNGMDY